eukprot:5755002-Pleurochrysis_carterae.AAC.3
METCARMAMHTMEDANLGHKALARLQEAHTQRLVAARLQPAAAQVAWRVKYNCSPAKDELVLLSLQLVAERTEQRKSRVARGPNYVKAALQHPSSICIEDCGAVAASFAMCGKLHKLRSFAFGPAVLPPGSEQVKFFGCGARPRRSRVGPGRVKRIGVSRSHQGRRRC